MFVNIDPAAVQGLTDSERRWLGELLTVYETHWQKNCEKEKYYEGKIALGDVNLGIALPEGMRGLEIGCSWGAKCVDVLAARSMFDGFVGVDGNEVEALRTLTVDNNLVAEYNKACRDELEFGCTFATLSKERRIGCKIRWHSPRTAAALWDGSKGRIRCGMAVIDAVPDGVAQVWSPSVVNYYTDTAIIVLTTGPRGWVATRYPHRMGRPLMEPMIWNATSGKPFGRSRIKWPVRHLIKGYVRTIANATIGLEFATSPQKYLMGVTDKQYDALIDQKFKQYVGSIIAGTGNPETGEKPSFGQLPQGNIGPHVEMVRILASQFSAATGLPVTDTGVVNDANPTSSDAIEAQTKTLVGLAEQLNTDNGDSLRIIALMALAIANNTTIESLSDEQRNIVAHFKNPAMPNVSVTADAAIKIATARPAFAETDTFLEMLGFSQADVRRIKAQEQRTRGQAVLRELGIE